jgi:DNA ligase D
MPGEHGSPREVGVDGTSVRLTSPDRPLWRDSAGVITKADLVGYYVAASRELLGVLRDRPTTLQRFPDGVLIDGARRESFYNKHLPKSTPDFVGHVRVTFPSGRTAEQVCPANAATLIWAANLGTVTFHPWPVTRDDVDRPDELRIDLDPQEGRGFADSVEVALVLAEMLRGWGAEPYVKTSGGRGLHVFVAVEPRWEFLDVRHAAIALGRELERQLPDLVTTAWWKEERGNRVFVDYNQMARDRTMASAWSVRARAGAPVSMPLDWSSLPGADPAAFTLRTVPGILREAGNPWATLGSRRFDISPLLDLWREDVDVRGLGEMPFPPDYPKMPGEPPRVQPSRARRD